VYSASNRSHHLQAFTYLTRCLVPQLVLHLPIQMTILGLPPVQTHCPYVLLFSESLPYSSPVVYLIHFPENGIEFLYLWYWGLTVDTIHQFDCPFSEKQRREILEEIKRLHGGTGMESYTRK
jgi:hypothetical protein